MTTPSPRDTFDVDDPFAENFSFEVTDNPEEIVRTVEGKMETQRDAAIRIHAESMAQVEKLILPLLNNLMKNPDKAYIKWENRVPAIKTQISKITAITRKPLDC
jgi:hypothetical protein